MLIDWRKYVKRGLNNKFFSEKVYFIYNGIYKGFIKY